MSNQLVECVPNFSEARRPDVVEAIKNSITAIDNVMVINKHSDLDHNRTVITFVGSPRGVEEAAFQAISKAAQLIDLNHHTGEHPRIGATDVVPFVPISGVSIADCVEIAKRLGKRVGEELKIPVYLYEEAATRPDRHNLENIRKGEYEKLKEEILTNPNRIPDYGPRKVGPAGATVIGARQFLIAYNVYLTTDQVDIAKKIARVVRNSSGGLRYVKALGFLVDGLAQVSMNLTNFQKTSLARVFEFIRREASRYGVSIHHSELVGLIPQDALIDTAIWYTQMDQFKPDQVLEKKLYAILQEQKESNDFLDDLAAGTPTPGGGSAAAQSGAMAAALTAMVARLTIGKKKYADVESEMQTVLTQAESIRQAQTEAVTQDANAFNAVMAAYKLPKNNPNRKQAIQKAILQAAQVPLSVANLASRTLELAKTAATIGNINAITDAGTAGSLAWAAMTSAGYNVRINLQSLDDEQVCNSLRTELLSIENKGKVYQAQLREQLTIRGELNLG